MARCAGDGCPAAALMPLLLSTLVLCLAGLGEDDTTAQMKITKIMVYQVDLPLHEGMQLACSQSGCCLSDERLQK